MKTNVTNKLNNLFIIATCCMSIFGVLTQDTIDSTLVRAEEISDEDRKQLQDFLDGIN